MSSIAEKKIICCISCGHKNKNEKKWVFCRACATKLEKEDIKISDDSEETKELLQNTNQNNAEVIGYIPLNSNNASSSDTDNNTNQKVSEEIHKEAQSPQPAMPNETSSNSNNKKAIKSSKEEVHQCRLCGRIFASSNGLGGHKKAHNKGRGRKASSAKKSNKKSKGPGPGKKWCKNEMCGKKIHRNKMKCDHCGYCFVAGRVLFDEINTNRREGDKVYGRDRVEEAKSMKNVASDKENMDVNQVKKREVVSNNYDTDNDAEMSGEWDCWRCTFINQPDASRCLMCTTYRK